MKRHVVAWILAFLFLTLFGCASQRNLYLSRDYAHETWQQCLASNPDLWKSGADKWFFTGESNDTEFLNKRASAKSAITTMSVAVPDFSIVKINGGFQTQIYGTSGRNSVDVYGPNAGVSSLSVDVEDNGGIFVHAHPDAAQDITKVIVRIGIGHLNDLQQMGCGPIEVIRVSSSSLNISSSPQSSGDIYLSGHVRLMNVSHAGTGNINVFGVDSSNLNIETYGLGGAVNLFGNVGVRTITHHGANDINIIGANSPSLCIFADGVGTVGVKGFVRLNKVETHDHAQVYVSQTSSKLIYSDAFDCSVIGLSGSVGNLYTNTLNATLFQGRSLCAKNVFAVSHDCSHINITACNKAYAKAYDDSSIYFFGPSYLLTSFTKGKAVVVPLEESNWCNKSSEYRAYDYTDAHCQVPRYVGAG